MSRRVFFAYDTAERLAVLAGVVLVAAACWAAATLYAVSRTSGELGATLLADAHQRQELATAVERLSRFGEIILHAPGKEARNTALAGTQALAAAILEQNNTYALDQHSDEVLSAIFAQMRELAANRDQQQRLEGLRAKRLKIFDALVSSVVEKIPAGSDAWNVAIVLAKLRLELEQTDATAETRWKLLSSELATQAKMLRLEGTGTIATLLERVPGQVEDLIQLHRRIRTYQQSNSEQWTAAGQLLDKLARELSAHDTPAEKRLAGLRAAANRSLSILLAAILLALVLGYAAFRKRNGEAVITPGGSYGTGRIIPDTTPPPAPASGLPDAPDLTTGDADAESETPDTLLPELRNLFARSSPGSLALADSLRKLLAQGPYKKLADEMYVRAAFGEYGKALESLEKLSGKLRDDGEAF